MMSNPIHKSSVGNLPNSKPNTQSADEAATGTEPSKFERAVGDKQRRKVRARSIGKQSPWFGLGMFGLVGWSVALPLLLGVAIGSWIDNHWPSRVSWTLTLMFVGLAIGCTNAWHWIQKESNDHE